MAQYYQILGQESPIQTVTIDELRQYYPNITCVEPGVQYLINSPDDVTQYQSRQVSSTNVKKRIIWSFIKLGFSKFKWIIFIHGHIE